MTMHLSNGCKSFRPHIYLFVFSIVIGGISAAYLTNADGDDDEHTVEQPNQSASSDDTYDIYSCCKFVFGSCRSACENLSLIHLAANVNGKDFKLLELRKLCPASGQTGFWKCMNRTLSAVSRGAEWSGRQCCHWAVTPRCENTCATSANRHDLGRGCRQSDEQSLYSCFERQETGEECCGSARTSECLQACREIFQSHRTVSKEQREHVERVCNDNNTNMKVLNCVKQFTDLTPINNSKQFLPCCDYSQSPICQLTCRNILEIGESTQEIIDTLENGGCGPPLPHEPLWQCFLSADRKVIHPSSTGTELVSKINQLGMDSAKLHCCHKALAPKCRRLCTQTFSNDWTETRGDFEADCYSKINEVSLKTCLDEVEEPCELGCDGLSFCSNFNNRPTELFRSCNPHADYAARADIEHWKANRSLALPGLYLPIKDVGKCSPELWRAISCVLQIKPCTRAKHATQICREDCYDILNRCMDWNRLETSHTPESICSKFSLEESEQRPCISLKPYLEPSDLPRQAGSSSGNHRVISPCSGHTCNSSEVCVLASKEEIVKGSSDYQCAAGCPLGETSSFLVSLGAYARIPISSKPRGCFKVCRCSKSGRLENCQPLPCISYESCTLSDKKIEHGTWFSVECNICSCFAGEITCTKRQCRIPGISDHSYTSLPCNCPPHYVPVCGRNGQTYPSACVSKCAGLKDADIEFGACRSKDPCKDADCPAYAECVENRHVCLTVMHRPCKQYQCVNTSSNCPAHERGACSSEGRSFYSICHLLKAKATLSYRGRCMDGCRRMPVCGINGVTYRNECEAWSDYSVADYDGSCREIGLLTAALGQRCASVKCPKRIQCPEGMITPPGACCPLCAGAIRIVYSRKQIDRALLAMQGKNTELLTLKGVLRSLEGLVRLANCRLSGFLTIESDLFVIVHSTEENPTTIQHEACIREAEKIATLIDTQSHRITSDVALSSLTVANFVTSRNGDAYDANSSIKDSLNYAILLGHLLIFLGSRYFR